jgi:hypothetical protein
MSVKSFGIAGLHHFNPKSRHSSFIRVGYHSWNSKKTNTTTGARIKNNGVDVFYGVGADVKINKTMKYRVEFERMKMDKVDLDNFGVSLLFNF